MILPSKHITLAESYYGLGGYILGMIDSGYNDIEELWHSFEQTNSAQKLGFYHTYDSFILAIDYLFMIGAICTTEGGLTINETHKTNF